MKNVEKINERDDIQEECCEFVRHLLWRYISKQNDDREIDKVLNSISSFRSSESVVQSTNPKRTIFDRISFVFLSNFTRKRLSCNFQYSRNARNTNGQYSFTLKWLGITSLQRENEKQNRIFKTIFFWKFYLLKFWLSIRIFVKALKCSGSNITGILTFSNSWIWREKKNTNWQIVDVAEFTEKFTLHIKTESNGSLARNNLCFWCRTLNFDFVLILCPSIDVIGRSENWQKERRKIKSISLFFAFAFIFDKW